MLTEFGSYARWLSDNRRLLFVHQDKLYLVDSQSRKMHEVLLAFPNQFGMISLSSDDRLIVYDLRVTEADIWLAIPKNPGDVPER